MQGKVPMTTGGRTIRVLIIVCLSWGVCSGQDAPPSLISTDEELAEYHKRACELIEAGTYELAIDILQSILSRSEVGFATEDSRHFHSLRQEISRTIGQLPPQGLALYRALYDPPAQRLYEQAMDAGDVSLLNEIVSQYRNTRFGAVALDALAQHAFDHAQFARAARLWEQTLEMSGDGDTAPLTLARVAVAYHMSREPGKSDDALARLKSEYPGAQAAMAGSQRQLADFVEQIRLRPARLVAGRTFSGWPGTGGVPGGVGLMPDCAMPEAPKWRFPPNAGDGAIAQVKVTYIMSDSVRMYTYPYGAEASTTVEQRVRDGQLVVQYEIGGRVNSYVMPALVQPVLAGDTLMFRSTQKIIALDLRSGKRKWEVAFPAEVESSAEGYYYYDSGLPVVYDSGHYDLTVADDKVFAVGWSLSSTGHFSEAMRRAYDEDGSRGMPTVLAAFSISQGKEIWSTRNAHGDQVELSRMAFVCPPTVQDGRLYVVGIYQEAYHLYCLDSDNGSMLWKSHICRVPTLMSDEGWWGDAANLVGMLFRCSPPAVADGMVAVATNSGVVSAFEADTGRSVWAYQYDSSVNNWANMPSEDMMVIRRPPSPAESNMVRPPVNPIFIAGGRVIALPADSDKVLCFDADSGRLLWQSPRQEQHHLSALDHDRLLLSRPGLVVLSAASGKTIFTGDVSDAVGRPAVMRDAVLISGRGRLYWLNSGASELTKEDLTSSRLPGADAITGNLITAPGRVIAANALGVCSYVNCKAVTDEITAMLPHASQSEQVGFYFERAWLAYYAHRFDDAYEDLYACKVLAESIGESGPPELQTLMYLSCVARANQADEPEQVMAMLDLADSYAQNDQEKAHNALRRAKHYQRIGDFEKAIALAHEIVDRYGHLKLVDVAMGPEANSIVRFDEDLPRVPAVELIHGRFLRDMIARHGQEVYAAFDAKAAEALAEARGNDNPSAMLAVAANWPNSMWADDGLYGAAEIYYTRALQAKGKLQEELSAKACSALSQVANRIDSPLAVSAQMGLAIIYARQGNSALVADACTLALEMARRTASGAGTAINFADVHGTLDEVAEAVASGELPQEGHARTDERLELPVHRVFAIAGDAQIMRAAGRRPLQVKDDVILAGQDYVMRVDSSAADGASAVRWRCQLTGQATEQNRPSSSFVGALDGGTGILTVIIGNELAGLAWESGEILWRRALGDGPGATPAVIAGGSGRVVAVGYDGVVSCLDMSTGEIRWRSSLPAGATRPRIVCLAGRFALVEGRQANIVLCYDLQGAGEAIGSWRGETCASFDVSSDNIFVVMVDGTLRAYDPTRIDSPLWERKFPADAGPAVLAASREGVVVGYTGPGACRLEVVSPNDGHTISRAETASSSGMATVAVTAALRAGYLYVFAVPVEPGVQPAPIEMTAAGQGLLMQKFDISDGRMLWQRDYTPEPPEDRRLLEPTITDQHLLTGFAEHGRAYVLSLEDGRAVPGGRFESVTGQPAVVAGRLVIPTGEGVIFYGPQ